MRVAPWVERRLAAWIATGRSTTRRRLLADAGVAAPADGGERDLCAGGGPRAAAGGRSRSRRIADNLLAGLPAASSQTTPAGLDVAVLRADLASRRAYLAVCEGYLRNVTDPAFAGVLQQVAELEQEIIYLLARALRQAGESAAEIAPNPAPSGARRTPRDRRRQAGLPAGRRPPGPGRLGGARGSRPLCGARPDRRGSTSPLARPARPGRRTDRNPDKSPGKPLITLGSGGGVSMNKRTETENRPTGVGWPPTQRASCQRSWRSSFWLWPFAWRPSP